MGNRLLTLNEASQLMLDNLKKLSPAEQYLGIYILQTGMGGFPRSKEHEDKIFAALKKEKLDG